MRAFGGDYARMLCRAVESGAETFCRQHPRRNVSVLRELPRWHQRYFQQYSERATASP